MSIFGAGDEVVTSTTRPATPSVGQIIYCTDTDEYLKYVTYGGANRWMQADVKPNRNVIINGGMTVAQRGTSFAMNLASPYYGLDRWMFVRASYNAGSTYSQQVGGPTGFSNFLRVQRNSGNALTADNYIGSSFETVNVRSLQGKYLTVGFWARSGANYSSASNGLNVNVRSGTGTDSNYLITGFTGTATVATSTVTLTSSWTFFSLTSSAVLSGSATQLAIDISNLPTGTAGANDYFDITGIQLEAGSAPSEFEFEPYETTLRKCQRYYFMVKNSTSNSPVLYRFNYGGYDNVYHCTITLPVTPRINNGITMPVVVSGNQIHKPNVMWDSPSAISIEALPGNANQYQLNVTPNTNSGSSFYGIYLYGIGIVYNGEL